MTQGQMILNGVVAVGHNDDTDSDSETWVMPTLRRRLILDYDNNRLMLVENGQSCLTMALRQATIYNSCMYAKHMNDVK